MSPRPLPPSPRPARRLPCSLLLAAALAACHAPAWADDPQAGDTPKAAGPRAALAGDLAPADVRRAAAKVADWQLGRVAGHASVDWTFAPLYLGFLSASQLLGDPRYARHVQWAAEQARWALGPRERHADDQAVGQAYLALYALRPEPGRLAALRARYDAQRRTPDDPRRPLWWWCDALFMAPPAWAGLAAASGSRAYLDYMDRQWWLTSARLYDPRERLFSRDASYLDRRERNGAKLFWGRGNGWVMAGLARVLAAMPADYPSRPRYLAQFRAMASRLAGLQGRDGLWRPGLLDAAAYPQPEVSGSALITYALAWGVRHRVLDAPRYLPVVRRAWRGLVGQVYADGRLGNIQPIGAAPDAYPPGSSYVYGVGAFLMAAGEVAPLGQRLPAKESPP